MQLCTLGNIVKTICITNKHTHKHTHTHTHRDFHIAYIYKA